MAEHGTDVWWSRDEVDLLPEPYKADADQYYKGTDTMDVWFDSGSSWSSVAQTRPELDCKPGEVDMDRKQHRPQARRVVHAGQQRRVQASLSEPAKRPAAPPTDAKGATLLSPRHRNGVWPRGL